MALPELALPHCETCPIGISETVPALQTLHPRDVTLQLPLLRRERQTTRMAKAVLARLKLMVERHPLIEHEALPLPATVLFRHLLEVVENSASKMMNLREAPLLQKAAGLLTTDSTGAKHGDARRRGALDQRAEMLFNPVRKIPKRLRSRVQRTDEAPHGHLVAISSVDHQRVGIIHQLIPVVRVHVGAHIAAWISTRLTQADDFALATGLETTKRRPTATAPLYL